MKSLFSILLFSLTFTSHASDGLIKLLDGSVAKCESRIDVARHSLSGVYRPIKVKKSADSALIKIEFLRCVENEGKFGFLREQNFESRKVSPLVGLDRSILVERSKVSLVAVNGMGKLIDRQELIKDENGLYNVNISIISLQYDDAPEGKKSLEIFVQSQYKMTDVKNGDVVDQGREALGSYRLVIK